MKKKTQRKKNSYKVKYYNLLKRYKKLKENASEDRNFFRSIHQLFP